MADCTRHRGVVNLPQILPESDANAANPAAGQKAGTSLGVLSTERFGEAVNG